MSGAAPAVPPDPGGHRPIALNALLSIGMIQVVIMLVAVIRAMGLAQLLGLEAFGVVSTIDQTAISVMQLGALSLPFTALKFLSAKHSDGPDAFQREFTTFVRAILALGLVATAVSSALLIGKPQLFGADLAQFRDYFLLAFAGVTAAMLNILFMHTLAAAQRGTASAVVNLSVLATLAVAAITGTILGGVGGLYLATLIAGVATTVSTLVYLRRELGVRILGPAARLVSELRANREIARYAVCFYFALATYSLMMLATRYFVFDQLGATGAGLLQALMGISLSVGAVLSAMNTLSFAPQVNRRSSTQDKVRDAGRFAEQVCVLLTIAGVGVSLFPQLVLTILYSSEFAPAAPVLFAFVLWQCAFTVANIGFQLLIGLDDIVFYAAVTSATYLGAAILFPWSVSQFGLVGVPLALGVSTLGGIITALARVRVRFGEGLGRNVGIRFGLAVVAVGGAGLLFDPSSEQTIGGVATRVAYAIVVAVTTWSTLTGGERRTVSTAVSRVMRRAPAAR